LLEQENVNADGRRLDACGAAEPRTTLVIEEILPRKQRLVAIVQEMELLNDNQVAAANQSTFLHSANCRTA